MAGKKKNDTYIEINFMTRKPTEEVLVSTENI